MSNCEVTKLPVLEVEQHQAREVLRCLLHTIIFSRALGPVKPQEEDSEIFDITYVTCGSAFVQQKIEEGIDRFHTWVEKHTGKQGQVCLQFYEKRQKTGGWFGRQEERLYWEQWVVELAIVEPQISLQEQSSLTPASVRARRHTKLQTAVEEALLSIICAVNDKKDHIPPVVSPHLVTFPFDITVAGEGGAPFGLDTVKRMLMQTRPPPVLS
ncbi:hypothetical protein WJX77_005384 [Trebouxia sp. C0004]